MYIKLTDIDNKVICVTDLYESFNDVVCYLTGDVSDPTVEYNDNDIIIKLPTIGNEIRIEEATEAEFVEHNLLD